MQTCSDESRVGESGGGWPRAPPAPANIRCSLSIPAISFSSRRIFPFPLSLFLMNFFGNKTTQGSGRVYILNDALRFWADFHFATNTFIYIQNNTEIFAIDSYYFLFTTFKPQDSKKRKKKFFSTIQNNIKIFAIYSYSFLLLHSNPIKLIFPQLINKNPLFKIK